MHKSLSRALGATRNYLTSRPLIVAFCTVGLADAARSAALSIFA